MTPISNLVIYIISSLYTQIKTSKICIQTLLLLQQNKNSKDISVAFKLSEMGKWKWRTVFVKAYSSDISRVFLGRPIHTLNPWRHHHGWCWAGILFQHCASKCFLCKTFSKLCKFRLQNALPCGWFLKNSLFINKICMSINLWELQSDLSCKDATSSAEGITQSRVNYLRHLIAWSRLEKKSRKSEPFHDPLCFK